MKVKVKNKIFNIRWPKEFDNIIIASTKGYKHSSGYVDWKLAEADGKLKGLPESLSLHDISSRYSFLKYRKTKAYKIRAQESNEKYGNQNVNLALRKKRLMLFNKVVPNTLKTKRGWKSKSIWSEKQKEILVNLTKKYRKSKITIDWQRLVLDIKVNQLPYQDIFKLMKYYGQVLKRKKTRKQKLKRRGDALKYKYDNYKVYKSNQNKRATLIKESVNEFLLSQLKLRK